MQSARPSASRFQTQIENCEVEDKAKLRAYREKWLKWMSWYELSDAEPNSIENQLQQMFFSDLAYRSLVTVRWCVAEDVPIAARALTLAHLLDQGYVNTQVLAIQKLLDSRVDVISVKRLLDDVKKHRKLITREIYVAGNGDPYDPEASLKELAMTPEVRIWGLGAPGLSHAMRAKYHHEQFDVLSGNGPAARSRTDTILESVFERLEDWISIPSVSEIQHLRHKFLAHAANADSRGELLRKGLTYSQIDESQRAIVRVERAVTDYILCYGVTRDAVPMAPLGIFQGLQNTYAPAEAQKQMDERWDELEAERNAWSRVALEDLTG